MRAEALFLLPKCSPKSETQNRRSKPQGKTLRPCLSGSPYSGPSLQSSPGVDITRETLWGEITLNIKDANEGELSREFNVTGKGESRHSVRCSVHKSVRDSKQSLNSVRLFCDGRGRGGGQERAHLRWGGSRGGHLLQKDFIPRPGNTNDVLARRWMLRGCVTVPELSQPASPTEGLPLQAGTFSQFWRPGVRDQDSDRAPLGPPWGDELQDCRGTYTWPLWLRLQDVPLWAPMLCLCVLVSSSRKDRSQTASDPTL